ncbi:unnamed protein product [Linum trigynum]|uniref:Uncharacterized protein n=1 Tax=Linum trigynum TaxID=586398 RepID=A0AAV2F1J9_9ROSI
MALVTTAEVCDANPQLIVNGELRALEPIFQIYGRRQVLFEDNVLILEFLEEKGNDRVLVVVDDGGILGRKPGGSGSKQQLVWDRGEAAFGMSTKSYKQRNINKRME